MHVSQLIHAIKGAYPGFSDYSRQPNRPVRGELADGPPAGYPEVPLEQQTHRLFCVDIDSTPLIYSAEQSRLLPSGSNLLQLCPTTVEDYLAGRWTKRRRQSLRLSPPQPYPPLSGCQGRVVAAQREDDDLQ